MPKGVWRKLTEADEHKIKDEYLDKPVKRIASELGISGGRVNNFLKKNGLVIPKHIIEQRKRESQFNKGMVSHNKGKKQTEYMTPEAIERTKATRFKKGNVPHNTKWDGAERISKDGYIEVRVSLGVYRHRHVVVWERENGPVPKGFIVTFKDGDKMNCDIGNLDMISMQENMLRNSVHNYPEEVIPSMALVSRIKKELINT
jgi:hypothetical protein